MDMRDKLIIAGGILILLGFLFVIGLGERGAADLYQLKLERDRLHRANLKLQEESQARYRTIERLKYDLDYVEHVARTELGMIRKDELIILKKKDNLFVPAKTRHTARVITGPVKALEIYTATEDE